MNPLADAIDWLFSTNPKTIPAVIPSHLYGAREKLVLNREGDSLSFFSGDMGAAAKAVEDVIRNVCTRWLQPRTDTNLVEGRIPRHYYELKNHGGAHNKVNLTAIEVIRGTYKHNRAVYLAFARYAGHFSSLFDDQVCAILLYANALSNRTGVLPETAVVLGYVGVEFPDESARLSTEIKRRGMARQLNYMVELHTLAGRGVAEIDVQHEAYLRTRASTLNLAKPDPTKLRAAIKQIYANELAGCTVEHCPIDDFWTSRWVWAANGSHNRVLEHAHPELATRKEGQMFRKAALESWAFNPMLYWDGVVFVTPSQKLEHGKSRLLLACDTVSYLWFEYYLKPVENAWRNKKALLNPGLFTTLGVSRLMDEWRSSDGGFFGLDYDDFNSQHSLESQKMVFEELFSFLQIDDEASARLIASFDKMQVWSGKKRLGYAAGTLMSGHRATTFINTVLNLAYLLCAGMDFNVPSLHVGDDVIMHCGRLESEDLLSSLRRLDIRTNLSKQVWHRENAEFLRVCHGADDSRGYLPRAIASMVSGNWVSDHSLDKREALVNAVGCCRTVINRSCGLKYSNVPAVICRSVSRRCGLDEKLVFDLLQGRACLEGGAVYGRDINSYVKVTCHNALKVWKEKTVLPAAATTDYLTHHVTDIERYVLAEFGSDIKEIMVHSSWKKALGSENTADVDKQTFTAKRVTLGDFVDAEAINLDLNDKGLLARYPLIMMLRNRISLRDARRIASEFGYGYVYHEDEIWGRETCTACIYGILPPADASILAKALGQEGAVIGVRKNIYA